MESGGNGMIWSVGKITIEKATIILRKAYSGVPPCTIVRDNV